MSLVITRNDQQRILIGDDIWITVHSSSQVKLEIEAPEGVNIVPEELIPAESMTEEDRYLQSMLSS